MTKDTGNADVEGYIVTKLLAVVGNNLLEGDFCTVWHAAIQSKVVAYVPMKSTIWVILASLLTMEAIKL